MKLKDAAPWKTNLDSMVKNRHITLLTKVHLVKAMISPVVMYGCENWTIKKAECWKIDAFELCYWRRLMRVPWTARRSNQSILKEISPGVHLQDWCWSWSFNILATLCEEMTHLKRPWCWERLKAGGEGDDRGWDGWMVLLSWCTWVWVSSRSWWWAGKSGMLQSTGLQRVGHDWMTELHRTVIIIRFLLNFWLGLHEVLIDIYLTPSLRLRLVRVDLAKIRNNPLNSMV